MGLLLYIYVICCMFLVYLDLLKSHCGNFHYHSLFGIVEVVTGFKEDDHEEAQDANSSKSLESSLEPSLLDSLEAIDQFIIEVL